MFLSRVFCSFLNGASLALGIENRQEFLPRKHHTIRNVPEDCRIYHQLPDWFEPHVIETEEWATHQAIATRLGQQAHTPISYAPHGCYVKIIVGMNYPTKVVRIPNTRAMTLDGDHRFEQPSLDKMMQVWIGILIYNGFDCDVARCLIYSSVMMYDLVPITASARWVANDPTGYENIRKETATSNKSLLKKVKELCPNVIGAFTVGESAWKHFGDLLEGTDIPILNENRVIHPCIIHAGRATVRGRDTFIEESLRMLSELTGQSITAPCEETKRRLIHVHPDRLESQVSEICTHKDEAGVQCMNKIRSGGLCHSHGQNCTHKDEAGVQCVYKQRSGGLCRSHGGKGKKRKKFSLDDDSGTQKMLCTFIDD